MTTIMLWCWWRYPESKSTNESERENWDNAWLWTIRALLPYHFYCADKTLEIYIYVIIGWWREKGVGEIWWDEWTRQKGRKVKSWCKTHLNKVLHPLNRLPTTWKVPAVTGYSLNFSLFSSFCSQLCCFCFSVVMSSHYKFLFDFIATRLMTLSSVGLAFCLKEIVRKERMPLERWGEKSTTLGWNGAHHMPTSLFFMFMFTPRRHIKLFN